MIVLDASVVIDLLLDVSPYAKPIAERIATESPELFAPYLLDVEVGQVLRRYVLRGEITAARALAALEDLIALPVHRYPHTILLKRAFELRDNVTLYDASYLALAEALGAPLLTRDEALAKTPGIAAKVERVTAKS